MGLMIYILMYFTVDIWFRKVTGIAHDGTHVVKPKVSDLNTVSCTIIQVILCLIAALHLLFLLCFPIVVCKYVSSHDDSFCKVFCARLRGFCKFWGESIKGYYYPMAVVNEEVITYTDDITTRKEQSLTKCSRKKRK